MNKLSFPSITSMYKWAGNLTMCQFLDNDETLPYVYKDKQYYYFALYDKDYELVMVYGKDLGEKK